MTHEDPTAGQTTYVSSAVYRKVAVKGSGGVSATVVVRIYCGAVSVSIDPPFTCEAIMKPEKVDELIRTLGQARDEAKRMLSRRRVSVETGRSVSAGRSRNTPPGTDY